MFGNAVPIIYLIRLEGQKWWLRHYDEEQQAAVWTQKPTKAHSFSTQSVCEEYLAKYLHNRKAAVVDRRIVNPYSMWFDRGV